MALKVKKKYTVPGVGRSHHKLAQRMFKREQRQKTYHRVVSGSLVLAVLGIGLGMAYTWYIGQNTTATISAAPTRTARAVFKPPKVASDARVGVSVQTITPEIKGGENASISIKTNPETECTISVKYNKTPATDSGLVPKTADEYVTASWGWTVPVGAATGKATIDVLCKNKKHSAVVSTELLVK